MKARRPPGRALLRAAENQGARDIAAQANICRWLGVTDQKTEGASFRVDGTCCTVPASRSEADTGFLSGEGAQ